ncbi:unnamed protein product [Pedinophyceae sp. YPF-701]|nr:unnamed protein product [Pedinophyceae sp. YPF-701]
MTRASHASRLLRSTRAAATSSQPRRASGSASARHLSSTYEHSGIMDTFSRAPLVKEPVGRLKGMFCAHQGHLAANGNERLRFLSLLKHHDPAGFCSFVDAISGPAASQGVEHSCRIPPARRVRADSSCAHLEVSMSLHSGRQQHRYGDMRHAGPLGGMPGAVQQHVSRARVHVQDLVQQGLLSNEGVAHFTAELGERHDAQTGSFVLQSRVDVGTQSSMCVVAKQLQKLLITSQRRFPLQSSTPMESVSERESALPSVSDPPPAVLELLTLVGDAYDTRYAQSALGADKLGLLHRKHGMRAPARKIAHIKQLQQSARAQVHEQGGATIIDSAETMRGWSREERKLASLYCELLHRLRVSQALPESRKRPLSSANACFIMVNDSRLSGEDNASLALLEESPSGWSELQADVREALHGCKTEQDLEEVVAKTRQQVLQTCKQQWERRSSRRARAVAFERVVEIGARALKGNEAAAVAVERRSRRSVWPDEARQAWPMPPPHVRRQW